MALYDLLAGGSQAIGTALNLLKQFLTQPMVAGISIQSEVFECEMEAEVSRHVLVDLTGGKKFINDNVAPGPRTWRIEGYVGGFPGELSSLFMPSIPISRAVLEAAYLSRAPVPFKDPSSVAYTNVLVSYFWYAWRPEVQNRMPVKLRLQELYVLTAPISTAIESAANPSAGTASGVPVAAGVTETIQQSLAQQGELAALTIVGVL